MGNQILNAVKRGLSVPQINWPKPIEKPDLPRNIGPVVDLLKVLLKKVSDETNVAGRLIANSADIELIAGLGEDAAVAALKGWRRQIFGADALRLRAGQLSIAIYKNKLIIEDR